MVVVFPLTLSRVIVHPIAMARDAESEIHKPADQQFRRNLSPPLFLLLAIALCHAFELYAPVDVVEGNNSLSKLVFGSEEGLLVYRTVSFAVWALCGALHSLWRTRQPIDRDSLRGPFYAQCYIAAPTAILASLAGTLLRLASPAAQVTGLGLLLLGVLFYIASQSGWIHHVLKARWIVAVPSAFGLALLGLAINLGVGVALTASS